MKSGIFDLVGVGFGPANLALAIQLDRIQKERKSVALRSLFIEKQPVLGWHTGMLLPDASLQIHFLKDLVTSVDPCSRFSFVNFLKTSGRLFDFINLRTNYPSREEYNEYLQWAASQFNDLVEYGATVAQVSPVMVGQQVDGLSITYQRRGEMRSVQAANVVLACGRAPHVPSVFPAGSSRIVHSSSFTSWLGRMRASCRPLECWWSDRGKAPPRSLPICSIAARRGRSITCIASTATARPTVAASLIRSSILTSLTTSSNSRPDRGLA